MRSTWALCTFSLRRIIHNIRYLIFTIGMPIGFYELYAHMYGTTRTFAHTKWGIYFMVSMAAFGAIGTTLNVTGTGIALDRAGGFVRTLRVAPVSPWSYFFAQSLTAMTASLVVVMSVMAVAMVSGGIVWSPLLMEAGLLVWLGSLAYAAIGLVLAHWLDATTVNYGILVVYLGSGMLGGLWSPLRYLPAVFTSIARVLPSFRMADMAWHVVGGQAVPGADVAVLLGYIVLFGVTGGVLYARRN